MADDSKQEPNRDEKTPPAAGTGSPKREESHLEPEAAPPPFDGDIFAAPFAQEPEHEDVFASLAEFMPEPDSLDDDDPAMTAPQGRRRLLHRTASRQRDSSRSGSSRPGATNPFRELTHLSRVQKILLVGIIAIAAAVIYVLVGKTSPVPSGERTVSAGSPSHESASPQQARMRPATPSQVAAPPQPAVATANAESRIWEPEPKREESRMETLPSPEPLSLQLADKLYLHRDFEHALTMYDKLYRRLPATQENQPIRDFLLLRMALCSKNGGNVAQADTLFRTVSLSRLPILRALARYHQSITLVSRKRYLEAAAKAYQTSALIEVANYDKKWMSAVQQQCSLLAAEAVTRNLLTLADADANLPPELWGEHPDIDPFVDMEEPQLRVFLAAGADQLESTVLSPQIRNIGDGSVPRWSVICNGASVEELLSRLAANAKANIRWTDTGQTAPAEDNVRARPVCLYLTSATTEQVVTMAAGSVGLVAQMDDKGNIRLLDPTSYSSLADHTMLLADEAITLWQRFLLTSENNQRAPNAHFAMGLLQAARGQFDEAVAEYKLVANRFAKHALAPQALLQSGMLKVRLRDYPGAHADLKQLVELYPETEMSDRACLYLADATMKAGLYEEATGLYRKVYNRGLSAASQTESALGAGRCFYETKDYEETAKWLSRYVTLTRDQSRPGFSAACLLLGKAYLALHKPQQAQTALNLAIRGDLSHQQHVETTAVLVKTYIEQELFLEALNTLEGSSGWQLSQQEAVELAILRAKALRAIGLADKAIAMLEEKSQYLPSPELQTSVALELANCFVQEGDLESARKTLGQAFTTAEPGPPAMHIGRELAGVCLRLGQTGQVISVCSQLLERACASEKQSILELLTDAYRRQGRYPQAVAAMLDRYETIADPNAAPSIRDN